MISICISLLIFGFYDISFTRRLYQILPKPCNSVRAGKIRHKEGACITINVQSHIKSDQIAIKAHWLHWRDGIHQVLRITHQKYDKREGNSSV